MGPFNLIQPQGMGIQGPMGGGGQQVVGPMGAGPAMDPRMMMAMMMMRRRHGAGAPAAMGMGAGPTGVYGKLYGHQVDQGEGAGPAGLVGGMGGSGRGISYPNPQGGPPPGGAGGRGGMPDNGNPMGGFDVQGGPGPQHRTPFDPQGPAASLAQLFQMLQHAVLSQGQADRLNAGQTPGHMGGAFGDLSSAQERALGQMLQAHFGRPQGNGPEHSNAMVQNGMALGAGRGQFLQALLQAARMEGGRGGEGLHGMISPPGYRMFNRGMAG